MRPLRGHYLEDIQTVQTVELLGEVLTLVFTQHFVVKPQKIAILNNIQIEMFHRFT